MGNFKLRTAREKRHWSMEAAADKIGVSKTTIARWEHGEQRPRGTSLDLVCTTFGMSAEELGFASPAQEDITMASRSVQNVMSGSTTVLSSTERWQFIKCRAIDPLAEVLETSPEQRPGAWLAQGAGHLAALFDEGWSLETVVEVLRIILLIVKAMPMVTRRRLLQTGVAATMSGIPIPDGRHISEEERLQLHSALSEGIAVGWKLFLTAKNAEILTVSQLQLSLIHQAHALLHPSTRSYLYAGAYGLVGLALHQQERNEEALHAYHDAHLAAVAIGDPWYVAQSLICQADAYLALNRYAEALQVIEEALLSLGEIDEEHRRARAHLLGCWADVAMTTGEYSLAQKKLDEAAHYLDEVTVIEEFDRICWLQLMGKKALMVGDYQQAIDHLEEALAANPPHWLVRHVGILIPLAIAYARMREREKSLLIAQQAIPAIGAVNAPMTNRYFLDYIKDDILDHFSHDSKMHHFLTEIQQQLPHFPAVDVT